MNRLREQNGAISVAELAEAFAVSSRTIRNDIMQLEDGLKSFGIQLQRNKRDGIYLLRSDAESGELSAFLRQLETENSAYSPEGRRTALIWELLDGNGTESIHSLSMKIGAGRTTTIADLDACELWLNERGVAIDRSARRGLEVIASEFNYRNAVLDHLWNSCNENDFCDLFDTVRNGRLPISNLFLDPHLDFYLADMRIERVCAFIRKYEQDMCLAFTDRGFLRVFIYLCIVLTRLNMQHPILEPVLSPDWAFYFDNRAVEWVQKNAAMLPSDVLMQYPCELEGIVARLICSNLKNVAFSSYTVPLPSVDLVSVFLRAVEGGLGATLDQGNALTRDLLLYVPVAVERLLHGIVYESPLKREVRDLYPDIFAVCERACGFAQKRFGKAFGIDELCTLTMLIASVIETMHRDTAAKSVLQVAVVCPNGVAVSKLLCSNILKAYPNIEIASVLSVEAYHANPPEADLTIGTMPLSCEAPYIQVSPFLKEEDCRKIDSFLARHNLRTSSETFDADNIARDILNIVAEECAVGNQKRLYGRLQNYFRDPVGQFYAPLPLSHYLHPDGVSVGFAAADCNAAIREAGRLLCAQGCVEARYVDSMVAVKEHLGAYIVILPEVALPHARPCDGVICPGFSFVTLAEPISFGHSENDPVRLIVGLAGGSNMQHASALMELISAVSAPSSVSALCACTSAEAFVKQLEMETRKNSGKD